MTIRLDLTETEWNMLLYWLGYATGAADNPAEYSQCREFTYALAAKKKELVQ